MSKSSGRKTLKSTHPYSGRKGAGHIEPNPGDKRYIRRDEVGRFTSKGVGQRNDSGHRVDTGHLSLAGAELDMHTPYGTSTPQGTHGTVLGAFENSPHNKTYILPPNSLPTVEPSEERPDFTEADKVWIDKIDRTQLSWEDAWD